MRRYQQGAKLSKMLEALKQLKSTQDVEDSSVNPQSGTDV